MACANAGAISCIDKHRVIGMAQKSRPIGALNILAVLYIVPSYALQATVVTR
jgi:hypothetical protein